MVFEIQMGQHQGTTRSSGLLGSFSSQRMAKMAYTDRNSVDVEQRWALECVTFRQWKQTIASDEHCYEKGLCLIHFLKKCSEEATIHSYQKP